jgi:uncharacterized membrane protein
MRMSYGSAIAIGAVSGLRSFTGLAIISQAAGNGAVDVRRTPLALMAVPHVSTAAAIMAATEMTADKLPIMPSRTQKQALIARFIAGAICGAAVSRARRGESRIIGALVGAATAVLTAYAGYEYREHIDLPPFAAAVVEDAVALTVGWSVVGAMGVSEKECIEL